MGVVACGRVLGFGGGGATRAALRRRSVRPGARIGSGCPERPRRWSPPPKPQDPLAGGRGRGTRGSVPDPLPRPAGAAPQVVHEAEAEILSSDAERESDADDSEDSDAEGEARQQPTGAGQVRVLASAAGEEGGQGCIGREVPPPPPARVLSAYAQPLCP